MRGVRGRAPGSPASRLLGQVPGHPVAPAAGGGTAEPGRRDPGIARRRIEEVGGAMTRRTLGVAFLLGMLGAPLGKAVAQSPEKVPRLGYLGNRNRSDSTPYMDAFRQGLR